MTKKQVIIKIFFLSVFLGVLSLWGLDKNSVLAYQPAWKPFVSVYVPYGEVPLKMSIPVEIYNGFIYEFEKEIVFDDTLVIPFNSVYFEKKEFNIWWRPYWEAICYIPSLSKIFYRNKQLVILKGGDRYRFYWDQKKFPCGLGLNWFVEPGTYRIVLKYCFHKTINCSKVYSNEFSIYSK